MRKGRRRLRPFFVDPPTDRGVCRRKRLLRRIPMPVGGVVLHRCRGGELPAAVCGEPASVYGHGRRAVLVGAGGLCVFFMIIFPRETVGIISGPGYEGATLL